jgi:hypothetical protein
MFQITDEPEINPYKSAKQRIEDYENTYANPQKSGSTKARRWGLGVAKAESLQEGLETMYLLRIAHEHEHEQSSH